VLHSTRARTAARVNEQQRREEAIPQLCCALNKPLRPASHRGPLCALRDGRRALLCSRLAPCPPPVGRLLLLLLHHCVDGSVSTSFAHPSPLGCDRHLPAVSGLGPLNARQTARRRSITLDCMPTTTPALLSAPTLPRRRCPHTRHCRR
jgi:hypothetical protein